MSPIYTVELSVDTTPVVLEFEILDRNKQIENPPNMNEDQQIKFRSMFANEYLVLVHSINGESISDGYAFARTLKTRYCGTVLTGIRLNGVSYKTDVNNEYWFPGTEKPEFDLRDSLHYVPEISTAVSAVNPRNLTAARPDFFAELEDGCVEICLLDSEFLYANPSTKPSFMDLTGTFVENFELVGTKIRKSDKIIPAKGAIKVIDGVILDVEKNIAQSIRYLTRYNVMQRVR
jgi:hypothetical protein